MASKKRHRVPEEIEPAAMAAYESYLPIAEAMSNETPRGVALIAVSVLEGALKELLRVVFSEHGLDDKRKARLLNGIHAPFGSFAMRIEACRAFGQLPAEACDLLDAIREIRNHFGHYMGAVSLNDTQISKWVRKIVEFNEARCKSQMSARESLENTVDYLMGYLNAAELEWTSPARRPKMLRGKKQAEPPAAADPTQPPQSGKRDSASHSSDSHPPSGAKQSHPKHRANQGRGSRGKRQ